jgi:hypothetical protein
MKDIHDYPELKELKIQLDKYIDFGDIVIPRTIIEDKTVIEIRDRIATFIEQEERNQYLSVIMRLCEEVEKKYKDNRDKGLFIHDVNRMEELEELNEVLGFIKDYRNFKEHRSVSKFINSLDDPMIVSMELLPRSLIFMSYLMDSEKKEFMQEMITILNKIREDIRGDYINELSNLNNQIKNRNEEIGDGDQEDEFEYYHIDGISEILKSIDWYVHKLREYISDKSIPNQDKMSIHERNKELREMIRESEKDYTWQQPKPRIRVKDLFREIKGNELIKASEQTNENNKQNEEREYESYNENNRGFYSDIEQKEIETIYKKMKGVFINKSTMEKDFQSIFKNEILPSDFKKIHWIKTTEQLSYFIYEMFLEYNPQCWETAKGCFVDRSQKELRSLKTDYQRYWGKLVSGKTIKYHKELMDIIKKHINPD